jgi:hypothetical protein
MAGKTVAITFLGNTAQLEASMASASATSDAMASNFSKAADDVTTKGGSLATKLGSQLSSWGIPFGKTIENAGTKFENLETKGQKFGSIMRGIGAVSVVALAGIAAEAIHVYDAFSVAETQYENSAKNAGESQKSVTATIKAAVPAGQALGFTNTQVVTSLNAFAIAGVTGQKAIKDLAAAQDLARAKNISLADATNIVVKATAGSTRGLTALGINADVGNGKLTALATAHTAVSNAQLHLQQTQEKVNAGLLKGIPAAQALTDAHRTLAQAQEKLSKDQQASNDIIDAVIKHTNGAADAYGKTLAGQMAVAQATIHNTASELGGKLAPALTEVVKIGGQVLEWVLSNKPAMIALGAVVGTVLVVAIGTFTAGLIASTAAGVASAAAAVAAGAAWVVAMAPVLVPILAIVAAFAVVGAAIYELVTHWKTVFDSIKMVVLDAVGFIKNNWQTILEIITGPVGLIVMVWQHFHDQIIGFFRDAASQVTGVWNDVVGFFTGLPTKIINGLGNLGSLLVGGGRDIVSGLIKGIGDSWGDVWNFIKSKLTGLMGSVLGFFGIHSPSTVFAGIGGNLMKGLAVGINDTASVAHAAMSAATSTLAPSLSASVGVSSAATGGSSQPAAASTGNAGPVIVQLLVDGAKFAEALFPDLQTVILQQGRQGRTVVARLA